MKTWIITLPFLCATGVAMAQGVEKEGAADQPAAIAVPAEPVAAPAEPVVVPAEIATPDELAATPVKPAAAPAQPAATPAEPAAATDKAKTPVKAKTPAKAKAPTKATSRGRMGKRGPKTLPTGDMRHCLELKTDAEIIRCSETRRKK